MSLAGKSFVLIGARGRNESAQLGHAPATAGDNSACATGFPGDTVSPCNAVPSVVSLPQ